MRFDEIKSRITGISCPVFGISWEPPESERDIAQRVIAFLEDRRVLYEPGELEDPRHCVESVLRIREYLTSELQHLGSESKLTEHLRAMRAACRKFLANVQCPEQRIIPNANYHGHYASWVFYSALGEMRATFGLHTAVVAAQYGLDVEDDLAAILPGKDEV